MKQHAAIVIAALMIASMAFAISTSNVSATHEPTVEITPTLTTTEDIDFEIKVTNTGGDPINNVEVTAPTGFALGDWVGTLMEGTAATSTLEVPGTVLLKGTKISTTGSLTLAENTPVTLGAATEVTLLAGITVIVPTGTTIAPGIPPAPNTIPSGTIVKLKYDTSLPLAAIASPTNLDVNLPVDAKVILPAGTEVTLGYAAETNLPAFTLLADTDGLIMAEGPATLVAETDGKTGPDVTAGVTSTGDCSLVEDTEVALSAAATIQLPEGTKVMPEGIPTSTDNEWLAPNGTVATLWGASTVSVMGGAVTATTSDKAELRLPPDYDITATLTSGATATLPANVEIVLPAEGGVTLGAATTLALPIPSNWTATIVGTKVTWLGKTAEDKIEPGKSLTFSIRANISIGIADGEHLWVVKTTDTEDKRVYKMPTTTVDGTPPDLTVTMEPYRVGAGPATIKVVASEPLSSLGNVYVELNNDPDERTLISMTPDAEKKVWTGTVTIPGNGLWDDNQVDIEILEGSLDIAGNDAGSQPETIQLADAEWINRRIDTVPPCLLEGINLKMTGDYPFPENTNQKSQLITGTAVDNITDAVIGYDNLTVKISVNGTTYETKSLAGGDFAKEIDLAEGPNTIKVWVVDRVGNVGPENEQVVFLDSLKPTISMVSVAGKAYENNVPVDNNTPTVVLTIKDSGLGVETFTVVLDNADSAIGVELTNAIPWDKATGRFENTIPLTIGLFTEGLPDGFYCIIVDATDVMNNSSSATFWFEVDTKAPDMPELTAANNPVLVDTSATEPKVQNKTALVFYGRGLEASSTANIYLIDQATGSAISTETTDASATGEFSKSLTLAEGKVIRIEVETIDEAGNVSSPRVTYGYVMVDATAPAVTLAALPETTDSASIILSGTVKKDSWEDWSDITLTLQLGTGQVTVPITQVSVNEGSYSYSLSLAEGANTIVVQAIDEAGNPSDVAHATVERTVTPWSIYAIILVILALILAAIAIFAGPKIWKR